MQNAACDSPFPAQAWGLGSQLRTQRGLRRQRPGFNAQLCHWQRPGLGQGVELSSDSVCAMPSGPGRRRWHSGPAGEVGDLSACGEDLDLWDEWGSGSEGPQRAIPPPPGRVSPSSSPRPPSSVSLFSYYRDRFPEGGHYPVEFPGGDPAGTQQRRFWDEPACEGETRTAQLGAASRSTSR